MKGGKKMAQSGMKIAGWVLVVVGLYGVLAMLVDSINWIPSILTGTWGWVISLVVLIIGGIILYK